MKLIMTNPTVVLIAGAVSPIAVVVAQHSDYQPHYLVGLLNLPNSKIPDELKNHTSGTHIVPGRDQDWLASSKAPFADVPNVGFSDIEFYYDDEGNPVLGEYYALSDNGFGGIFEENSADFALNIFHVSVRKPFTYRHGESTFDTYTEARTLGTAILHDPNKFIKWENGADIEVTYQIPDSTWDDWKEKRVLTGRDLDPEGLAVIKQDCAVLGDEHMPAVVMVNPKTGVILSPFVRTPDIDSEGNFVEGMFLSTIRDKALCKIEDLEANSCPDVKSEDVDAAGYRRHDPSGGYEGFALLDDGSVAAFLEKNSGDTTLGDEPGARVYRVLPGDCTPGSAPKFDKFIGYYPFELNAERIGDVSPIPGSSRHVLVIERNSFPRGHLFPAPTMPANKLCVVDLEDLDEDMVMRNKKCILNYHSIDDPWDVDGNGIFKAAMTQVTNEAVIVVDDYCIVACTDTNHPWTNQFALNESDVPYFQEVSDTRFMVICFVEPIFNVKYPLMDKTAKASKRKSSSSSSLKLGRARVYGLLIGFVVGLFYFA
ncbi:hypothetical protein ACHAWF_011807 [Thalassiosira exigua]